MLRVGLTGGIAAGKSVAGKMFVDLGAHVIQADQLAHDLMQPGKPIYKKIVRHFGMEILDSDQTINRGRLAELAFGRSGKQSHIDELNAIVHPVVIAKQEAWMDRIGIEQPDAIAIVEAALILEAGMKSHFDSLVVVTCEPEQRIQRWMERVHVDEPTARAEVARRMAAQFPDDEKVKAADYVIDNSRTLDETRHQVEEVFTKLKSQVTSKV
jgi:dephospho-CoA kinase